MPGELIRKKTAQVSLRMRLNRMFRVFCIFLLSLSIVYGLILVVSRLLNLIPWKPDLASAFIPAAASLLFALLTARKSGEREAVHVMDRASGTKDLFLTNLMLEGAAGKCQDIVIQEAEAKAEAVSPAKAVPLAWKSPLKTLFISTLVLIPAVFFLPQLDPFGKDEVRKKQEEWEKKLEESRKAAQKKLAVIKKTDTSLRNTKPVETALTNLKQTLRKVEKGKKIGNLKRLGDNQKQLGDLWRKASSKQMSDGTSGAERKQRFGTLDPKKASEWEKKLKKGDASGMKQEAARMKRTLSRLQKETDPAEKEKLKQELRQQLKDMEEFFSNNMNAPGVRSALKQAMDQLTMSDMQGLSDEALQALKESLSLSEAEMDRFAQTLRDMKDLEQALLTLQKAKQLNQAGLLDGQKGQGEGMGQGGMSLKEYEDMYNKMLAQSGMGDGPGGKGNGTGMKGEGTGEGGEAPEKDNEKTAFTPEQSKSALTAGKILMKMETRGMGEKGEMKREYSEMVREVKQGVSEAIIQEEVPPDYHEFIKGYFDTLKEEGENEQSEE